MSGLKPAVIGMIGTAVLSIGKTVFVQPGMLLSAVLFGAMAVLAFKKVHPIIIICISAAVGVLMGVLGV
jgi:chromate transporter